MKNILIVIDDLEFKYFEFNKLVTNFWLIKEYLLRGNGVDITLKKKLYLKRNIPFAQSYKTYLEGEEIKKTEQSHEICLNEYNTIFFRPDPPVDMDYINASYILSYVDNNSTFVMNSAHAIREKNEKLYVNEFQGLIPDNIVASDEKIIKEFLFEKGEIVIKPTNRCFGSGVFYLNSVDKNINTILQTATNNYTTAVMVQEYLPQIQNGDKRLIYVCGKIFDYCVKKVATNNDFKFNEHNKDTLKFAQLNSEEKLIEQKVKDKFEHDGIYLAGLDVIDGKIIEINITSPCFFINEINNIFDISFEKMIVDRIELYANSRSSAIIDKLSIC
ncbi:MAG: hypothetical protein IJ877_07860 [Candidatus Gastranaerophilales bacterium]|nr:hypothetical protein [Candidatus Gastranaerophilales bacterium]